MFGATAAESVAATVGIVDFANEAVITESVAGPGGHGLE